MRLDKVIKYGLGVLAVVACNAIVGNEDRHLVQQETCTLNSDCPDGRVCLFERCSEECQEDVDCATDLRCLQTDNNDIGACVSSASAVCTADAECPAGTTCGGGQCRKPCVSNADCRDDQTCTAVGCVGTSTDHDPGSGGAGGRGGSSGAGTGGGDASVGGDGGAGAAPSGGAGGLSTGGGGGDGGAGAISSGGAGGLNTGGEDGGPIADSGPDAAPPPPVTLTFLPAGHDFGALPEDDTSGVQSFTIQNIADSNTGTITASIVGPFADQFQIELDTCSGLVHGPLDTCTLSVRFLPALAGPRSVTLTLTGTNGAYGTATLDGTSIGAPGTDCTDDSYCQSGNCVDGVCCSDTAAQCNGCYACNVSGFEGACTPVETGTDPHNACAPSTCASGSCDGSGACGATGAGVVCDTACSGGNFVEYKCSGSSTTCGVITTTPCPGGNLCANAEQCATSCANDLACALTHFCNGSTCTPRRTVNQACDRDRQCENGKLCDGSKCVNCYNGNIGCVFENNYCVTDSNGNYCASCTFVPSFTCTQAGMGSSCSNDPDLGCQCSSSSQCASTGAPYCVSDADYGNHCACYLDTTFNEYRICPRDRPVCVNQGATDAYSACKGNSRSMCTTGSDCVSGGCTAGTCD